MSSLFKLCAFKMGLDTASSIKYQVVCDSTALIGVVKQKHQVDAELETLERVQFGRQRAKQGEQSDQAANQALLPHRNA